VTTVRRAALRLEMGCASSGHSSSANAVAVAPHKDEKKEKPQAPSQKSSEEVARIFACAEKRQLASGGTSGAELLHSELPAEFWGISREQLLEFTERMRGLLPGAKGAERQQDGLGLRNMTLEECRKIGVPHYDDHKFADLSVGPNMYQVNEGLVKPETLKADPIRGIPFLSYAVQKNSQQGLRCDLFISHAWAEGLFEFTHAVVQAWPSECQGAYICVFSNPQNMGDFISSMIKTPQDSPFYRVLSCQPKQMLMVANCNVAIHSRLWCVYEAHCARVMQISIAVAGDPASFATDARLMKTASRAIHRAVEARKVERAIQAAADEAASDFDIFAAGVYESRSRKALKKAGKKSQAAMTSMKQALDVRKASCTNQDDGIAIGREIAGGTDQINAMVCDLIVNHQLERTPVGPCKLTWYPGQEWIEGTAAFLGWW